MDKKLPSVFIGSSNEAIKVARAIEVHLEDVALTTLWKYGGVFGQGSGTLESLMEALGQFDFAVMVLSRDDKLEIRDQTYASPRDNVIFELGLFMGRLGRRRSFIVRDKEATLRLPSDLNGITVLSYHPGKHPTLLEDLSTTCTPIIEAIESLGPRGIVSPGWYGIQFTTPGAGTTIERSPLSISGKFEHRPPDGALHIFVVSDDRNRWWPVAEAELKDRDRTWSAKVPFDKGDVGLLVVAAFVSESSVDLVQYFEKLPRHLETSERKGHQEFKERKEFDSLFRDVMSDGIEECDYRNIRVKI